MASPTWWTWVWVGSRNWWWTGKPGVPQTMGSQRVGHDRAPEQNWTELVLQRLSSISTYKAPWWDPSASHSPVRLWGDSAPQEQGLYVDGLFSVPWVVPSMGWWMHHCVFVRALVDSGCQSHNIPRQAPSLLFFHVLLWDIWCKLGCLVIMQTFLQAHLAPTCSSLPFSQWPTISGPGSLKNVDK